MSDELEEIRFHGFKQNELVEHGDDIQKLSVVQALPQLIQREPQQTYSRILPKILQELPNSSCEFHVITSKVFRLLMEKHLPCNLLHAVLQGIESRDLIVSNSWMETLLAVIGVLSIQQIKTEIIPLINVKSVLNQPVLSRVASCKILGKVAIHPHIDATDVKRDLLPLAQSLCQDCHGDVRMNMCKQLPNLAKGLGDHFPNSNLMVSLVELASDDSSNVASSAITTTVNILPYTSDEVKRLTVIPMIKQLFDRCLRSEDVIATVVAAEIGKLLLGLQKIVSAHEATWFLNVYKTLSHRGLSTGGASRYRAIDTSMDVLCRQNCATNLPLMLSFAQKKLPGELDSFSNIVKDLSHDPCYIVRRTIASHFYEILKLFENKSVVLKRDLIQLLRDDSEEVLQMLIPTLGDSLVVICGNLTASKEDLNVLVNDIGKALLKCLHELNNGFNWRLLTQFLAQLEMLPHCMPHEYIHQNFTPLLLNIAVQGRAKPVRTQAARTLLMFLRYNGRDMQRRWLRENLVTQLCYSSCCYTRAIFVRMCIHSLEIFSEKYFKEHFYDHLLDLAEDPVSNIRLCVVSLFIVMRDMLVLPGDQMLFERLQEVFSKFSSEKSKDIVKIYNKQINEIKKRGGSLVTARKVEHEKEEKRRQDEEDKLMLAGLGKTTAPPRNRRKSMVKRVSSGTKASTSSRDVSSATGGGIYKSGVSRESPLQSDLNFLEQHFYIDAGITLPVSTNLMTVRLRETENIGNNITDDEKVNMRKSDGDKRTKRYSSVISSGCLIEKKDNRASNRRSLNLKCGEGSKIPVSVKKTSESEETKQDEIVVDKPDSGAASQNSPRTSNLPILKRRAT